MRFFKINELDPVKFLIEVKLELLTDINMLLMVKKKLKEEYVMLFINMVKLITNIWKTIIKIKNHYILNTRM